MNLPDGKGIELVDKIRAEPRYRDAVVIMRITVHDDIELLEAAF